MLKWYLLYTKPKNEDVVSKKLSDIGFEVLNPKLKERKYIRRKLVDAIAPLFPCYIFVKFDDLKSFRLIKYTRGVKKIVGADNAPLTVPEGIITSLMNRMNEGIVEIGNRKFEPGEEVFIKAGPFEGFDAVFERELKGSERVSILLKTINARAVVEPAMLESK